ncbi:MAG TPA: nucleotidyltransferase domain-containing protein [Pseudolabrys sp.]|jgi:predicted nucleotidyltransferase|nr:nucleotidyltransferase domain-containing protein [Pseudolabrys sp.]
MGKRARPVSLASALFSQVQLRVLSLFFGQPDRTYQISDVIRLAESGRGAVQRELEKLTAAGILSVSIAGTRKSYRANRQSPIFNELYRLIMKTAGMVDPIRTALEPFRQDIELAFVYGSVAKGTDTARSDIDLMVFAQDTGYGEIYGALQKAEKILMRPINPTVTTIKEWQQKYSEKSSFVRKIIQQPKLFIFGTANELKRVEQSRQDQRP